MLERLRRLIRPARERGTVVAVDGSVMRVATAAGPRRLATLAGAQVGDAVVLDGDTAQRAHNPAGLPRYYV